MQGKEENKKVNLKNVILIILVCVVADVSISIKTIHDFSQFSVDIAYVCENNKEDLKDFALEEDGRLIAESDDPWVYYPLQQTLNVKTVEIDVDSVSIQDTWAELHFILEDGSWEHQSFFIHDGTNTIKVNGHKGLNNISIIRFDFVSIKDASVKINNVIVNRADTLTFTYHMVFLLFALSLIIVQVLFNLGIVNWLISNCQRIKKCDIKDALLEKWTFMCRPFAVLVVIYLIGISAILRANFNYIDDMGRVAEGYKQWNDFSRYISYYLSSFIHGDQYLTDVSPLPQLIAVIFLALSGIIVLDVISEQKVITKANLIAAIPLGLSPYFLECISYKYDSPYMALSILASVCPLLLYNYNIYIYLFVSIVAICTTCTTYQASLGVYPMLVMLICMRKWNKGESLKIVLKILGTSILGYMLGLLIFKVAIMNPGGGYRTLAMPSAVQILPIFVSNLRRYFLTIEKDLKVEWIILILLMQVAFIILTVKNSKRNKFMALIITMLTVLVMLFSAFGIYPLLEEAAFTPRSMYGFGIYITYIGVCISYFPKEYFAKLVSLALSWCFFVFAFTYGNALEVQSNYTNFRISMVISDLNDIDIFSTEKEKVVQLSGSIGFSPILKNMPQDYQILNRLVPITFGGGWSWGQCGFYNYYGLKNIEYDWRTTPDIQNNDLPIIKDTMYHTIRGNDDYILIELK